MRLSVVGIKVVKAILEMVDGGLVPHSPEIPLKYLEEVTGCRVQSIGMAFDDYIKKPLEEKGIKARKCGTPVVIQW